MGATMKLIATLIVLGSILIFLGISRVICKRKTARLAVAQPDLLRRTGVAITQLRPTGAAFINGKRVEVMTEGALIDQGASIKVVAVEGARVVVRAL